MEEDHLKYIGNKVPRVLRFLWTIFFVFMVIYLAKYMWPDLVAWMGQ